LGSCSAIPGRPTGIICTIDRAVNEINMVYADDKYNAVFPRYASSGNLWERTAATGANLRGTYGENNGFHGLSLGSSREDGWFWLRSKSGEVNRIFVTESPIDAILLMVLDQERQKQHEGATVYLSSDGNGAMPIAALQSVLDRDGKVAAAFDADKAGEAMAWEVAHEIPGIMRAAPAWGKDWNERLRTQPDSTQETQRLIKDWDRIARALGYPEQRLSVIQQLQERLTPELQMQLSPAALQQLQGDRQRFDQSTKTNWYWYGAAIQADKSDAYISRLVEVAQEFNSGTPMNDRALSERQKCIDQFQQVQPRSEAVAMPDKSVQKAKGRGVGD
jgi:Toprim-like